MKSRPLRHENHVRELLETFSSPGAAAGIRREVASLGCPRTSELEALLRGELSAERTRQLRLHVLGCLSCAQSVDRVRHPSEDLLARWLEGQLPVGDRGEELRQRIDSHIRSCDQCQETVRLTQSMVVFSLEQASAESARLMQLVRGLVELAHQQRQRAAASRAVAKTSGDRAGRRALSEEIEALVVDEGGKVRLDASGEPEKARFRVLQARIEDRTGVLFVELLTEGDPPGTRVELGLRHGTELLLLPPVALRSGGEPGSPRATATVRIRLGIRQAVRPIPAEALSLTVLP